MNDNKLDSKNVGIDFSNKNSVGSIEENDNEIVITIPKKKNYTIQDLKQKMINLLYDKERYYVNSAEVELLDVILKNEH